MNFFPYINFYVTRNFNRVEQQLARANFKEFYITTCTVIAINTKLFTSLNATEGLLFLHLTILIDKVAAPIFAAFLEEHREVTLVPAIGQIGHLVVSSILANSVCWIFFRALSFTQIIGMGSIFLVSMQISKRVLKYFKTQNI